MLVKDVVHILVRLVAIYMLYKLALPTVSYVSTILAHEVLGFQMLFTVAFYVLTVSISVFCWVNSKKIALLIAGDLAEKSFDVGLSAAAIERSGFAIIGMVMIADSMPVLIANGVAALLPSSPFTLTVSHHFVEPVITLIVGLMLLLGSGFLVRLFKRLRQLWDG